MMLWFTHSSSTGLLVALLLKVVCPVVLVLFVANKYWQANFVYSLLKNMIASSMFLT